MKKAAISLCLLLGATNVFSQGGMGAPREEVFIPDVDKESFIWQIPSKWFPYSKESDVKVDAFLFPTGQEPTDFKEMLHFEEFRSTMGVTEAISVYQLKTQSASAGCPTYTQELESDKPENGYSTVQWSENCISGDGSAVYGITKAVVGNDRLYVAKKAWKYEPSASEQRKWNDFLQKVYVCDPTTGVNDCVPPSVARDGDGRTSR